MAHTMTDLTSLSQEELDDLFRTSPPGEIPDGDALGSAIVAPGSDISAGVLWFARWLAWQGKIVDRNRMELVNKVTPFSLQLFRAQIYTENSWFDGKPAIILDYSKTSLLAKLVRDEIREISPGTFLGIVFYGRLKTINFLLEFGKTA
jgi:hypothetical protein